MNRVVKNVASEERYQLLEECRQKSETFKRDGDMYGWNFLQGMSAGANWADLYYHKVVREIRVIGALKIEEK